MTSDIRSLINECPSVPEHREAEKHLREKAERRKTSENYKRETNYLRGLGTSIITISHSILWLKLVRAPDLKIEKLKTKLKKRQTKLASATKAAEAGWHHAWRDQVRSYRTNRFYWVGVTAYRKHYGNHCRNDSGNDSNPARMRNKTRIRRKESSFMLWDNWGGKPPFSFFHQQPRDELPQEEIKIKRYAALRYNE